MRNLFCCCLFVLTASLLAGGQPASAQGTDLNLAPAQPGLKEILGETSLSSGAAIHGVQIALPDGAAQAATLEPTPLTLYLPPQWLNDGVACLKTVSIDGRYAGGADYEWAEAIAGPQAAGYETTKQDYLTALKSGELAVSLTRGSCAAQSVWAGAESEPLEISIASWRHAFYGATLQILVNGFSATEVTLAMPGKPEVPCATIDAETRAAYNLSCALSLEEIQAITAENGFGLLSLQNYTNGVPGREIWLKLYVPAD